ncbi:Aldehyde/histidinol dehydrogenase [Aspergillus multicolor]|uniref:Aldehyde/histidinol dehydrogenase n=1 Tax=Aspergillus multicolor TaxID=41759 RepID=UPI003CCE3FC0
MVHVVRERGTYADIFTGFLHRGQQLYAEDGGKTKVELQVTRSDVVAMESLPSLEKVDCVLLTGSKHSAFGNDRWILRLLEYVKTAIESDRVRVLGICFGHQIIGRALGGAVITNPKGWEISVDRIDLTPVGPRLFGSEVVFPYLIIVNSLNPVLLAGTTVVIKSSPQTPLVAERITEIFHEAGLPSAVLQILHCGNSETLNQIVQIPDIKLATFTGSTTGGRALRQSTAGRFLPLTLELGGNDPAYVRADADLKYTAEQLVDGAVFNAGQSCCAVERIYVHAGVHDAFVEEVKKELATYKLGDPTDPAATVGPVISRAAQKAIWAHIQDALDKGVVDVTPPNSTFATPPANGNYAVPTILTNVDHTMAVMKEETFGPVIPIMRVSSDEEAVRLMNDSDYGLTASIWTRDLQGGEKLLRELEAGTLFINRCDYPSPDLAWSGWKNSGMGFTLGPRAFEPFVSFKSFHVKEE